MAGARSKASGVWSRRAALGAVGSLGLAGLGLGLVPACQRRRSLSLYNWGDYLAAPVIERFDRWLRNKPEYAELAPAKLVQDFYLSEAELAAKLEAGARYDLCVPIDYLLSAMQRDGLLQELDPLPEGVAHLSPDYPPWQARAERGGGVYAIPYLWGTTGIGYDSEKIPEVHSWSALFDERYAGRISVIDSKGDVMDQALLACGMSINSTDKPRIREEVWPKLKAQKQILRAYDSSPAKALIDGQTWIAQIDSGDLLRARKQKPSLRYVIPEEGAAMWVDYLAIPAKARRPKLARAFIEFMLEPEIAALNANVLRFATPNQSAIERGLIERDDNPHLYPGPNVRERLFVSENWDGGTAKLVDELWLELRAG